jgi:hypothetical protein
MMPFPSIFSATARLLDSRMTWGRTIHGTAERLERTVLFCPFFDVVSPL